ncbi:MAG: Ig-like domain-containing protein, partial [Pseudomonadota bacterium]
MTKKLTTEALCDPAPVNVTPVAMNDAITAAPGDVAVLNVLANDTDADGDALTITNVGKPQQGTAVLNDDGTITYTANDDAKGTDSYTYTVSDGNGGSDTATITATFEEEEQPVDPHPANTAPVATDDSADTAQGEPIAIDVVANDTDADGDTLTVKAVGDAANGMTSITDGKAIYTPNPDFCGTDSFDYTVIDGNDGEDTGRVTVTVEAGQVVGADPVDPKAPVVGEDSKDDNDTPVADEKPKADDPVDEQPVADTPVNDEPVGDKPVNDQPVADTPVSDQPVADAPKGDGGGSASGGDVIDNEFGGKDYFGTDGDDVLKGGAGNDGFLGSGGNDTIDGGAGHNQIDYLGSSSEYAITRKGDTLSVVKPSGGTDTVSNVSGVYFFGDDVYKTVE